jgi:hypothetical protein
MSTVPSGLELTDAHAHLFSHEFFRTLLAEDRRQPPPSDAEISDRVAALGLEPPPIDPGEFARRWVDELDRHGVAKAVLIASVPRDWPGVAWAVELYPERFAGYTIVDPRAADAVTSAERALVEGGLRGLCFFPAMHRMPIDSPEGRALLNVARKHHAVAFCHCGLLRIPIRDKLGLPSPFDGALAVPTDLHRVAADYPEVTFQIPHFGAGYLRETLLLGAQCPNVVVDTSSSNSWMRLMGHPLTLDEVVRATLDVFGPERILWGSDSSAFPRGWRADLLATQLEAFEGAGCDRAAIEKIFGGNVRRVLGEAS